MGEILNFPVFKFPWFQVPKEGGKEGGRLGTNDRSGNCLCDIRANERPKQIASNGANTQLDGQTLRLKD